MCSVSAVPYLGVNVFGYLYSESGMGEQCRQLVYAIRETGIPYAAVPYTRTLTRQNHPFEDPSLAPPRFPVNIVVVNADEFPHFAADVGEPFMRSRYTIGIWAWEIEDFPSAMASSQLHLDEVWAISSFGAEAIRKRVDRPVHPFPVPVTVPDLASTPPLGWDLPEGFVFLFCFDFDSIFERKNPTALVRAFLEAFPGDDQVSLIIKSINGSRAPEKLQRLRASTGDDRRISIIDEYWDAGQKEALMASCDAYVSLHRSEGFGLTMAEAMALGKPVIATGYSGNLDFMNDDNSYLITAHPADVPEGCAPYPKGARWSEPDITQAAALMRHVVRSPDEAREKAARGRADIERHHSPTARSRHVGSRLEEIFKTLSISETATDLPGLAPGFRSADASANGQPQPSGAGFVGAPPVGESEALAQLEARLEAGPDLRRATRLGQPGLWLRRLMFRLIKNYHLHQLQLGRSMLMALRELDQRTQTSRQRLETLEQRIETMEQKLDQRSSTGESDEHG